MLDSTSKKKESQQQFEMDMRTKMLNVGAKDERGRNADDMAQVEALRVQVEQSHIPEQRKKSPRAKSNVSPTRAGGEPKFVLAESAKKRESAQLNKRDSKYTTSTNDRRHQQSASYVDNLMQEIERKSPRGIAPVPSYDHRDDAVQQDVGNLIGYDGDPHGANLPGNTSARKSQGRDKGHDADKAQQF